MRIIPLLPEMYGEPFADNSQLATYLVSKLAREQVTVSLSGDAGDELFCGYDSYEAIRNKWNTIKSIPLPLRKAIASVLNKECFDNTKYLWKIGHLIPSDSPETMLELEGSNVVGINDIVRYDSVPECKFSSYPRNFAGKSIEDNLSLMDFLMYLPDDILVKVDRASMAVSLESRIPLLDKDLIEFAWTLPSDFKITGKDRKRILKKVLYRHVPETMMQRPKKGFAVPVAQWLRYGELRGWGEELLDTNAIKRQGILNEQAVQKLWERFIDTGQGYGKIWSLLMFEQWMKDFGL